WVTVPDPLMSAGVLGSLLLYLKYKRGTTDDRGASEERLRRKSKKNVWSQSKTHSRAWWIAASTVACLAALMAKETAVVMPTVVFVMAVILPLDKIGAQAEQNNIGVQIASAFRATLP